MLRRALLRLIKRTLWVGGAMFAARWAMDAIARAVAPAHPDIALHAGLELTGQKRKVLVIAAHPGEAEFHVGGTLKLLVDGGSDVTMAVLSKGEAFGNRANMGEVRSREQEASAASIGARMYQLNLPDGAIRPKMVLDALTEMVRKEKPDCILVSDPDTLGPNPHPDQAAAAAAILDMAHTSVLKGVRIYFYGTHKPNVIVDVTEVLQEKVSAVQCHRSQLRGPDGAVPAIVKTIGRLAGQDTPATYTETLCRIV